MNNLHEEVLSSRSMLFKILETEKNEKGEIIVSRSFGNKLNPTVKFHFIDGQKFCYISESLRLEIPLSNSGHVHFLSKILCSKEALFHFSAQKIYDSFRSPLQSHQIWNNPLNLDHKIIELRDRFTNELKKGNIKSAMQVRRTIENIEDRDPCSPIKSVGT